MDDDIERMLAEAEDLLSPEIRAGDRLDKIWGRHVRAQRLILLAQIEVVRRQARSEA